LTAEKSKTASQASLALDRLIHDGCASAS